MLREVNATYATAFREGSFSTRLQLLWLLWMPLAVGVSTAWLLVWR